MAKKKAHEASDVFNNKTAEKVRKLEDRRAELVDKRNLINENIKEIDKELATLKAQWREEKVEALLALAKAQGYGIDDLYIAAKDGDFLSLQDKIENVENAEKKTSIPKQNFTDEDFGENEEFEDDISNSN